MNKIENENDITMNHIRGNWRYKVFRYKDKVYLLDGSTYWFSFLLVITKWLHLPIKAYEVDEAIIKEIKEEVSAQWKKPSWNTILLIVFVSGIIAKFVDKIIYMLNFREDYNIVYLYTTPIIFIVFFLISRHLKKKKILNLLNGQCREKRVRFKLSPEKNVSKDLLFSILIFSTFLILGSLYFIRNIIRKIPDARDYLGYFLAFVIWFALVMSSTIRPKDLVGATVIIKDKERK